MIVSILSVAAIVLAVILAAMGLFLLLRFAVTITYGQAGLKIIARVGIIPIKIYPTDKKILKKKRKKSASDIIDTLLQRKKDDKKPGKLETFFELFKLAKDILNRVRKKLLIKNLDIHFISAGKDPVQAALMYGSANAVYGVMEPVLERNFRLRRFNFTSEADFESTKPLIYVNVTLSIAVWELLYIMGALIPKPNTKSSAKKEKRKEKKENGKNSD